MNAADISLPGVMFAHLLPLLTGAAIVYALLKPGGRWNGFVIAGQGYLLGLLLTTTLMRVCAMAGLDLQFWPLLIFQFMLAMVIAAWAFLRVTGGRVSPASGPMVAWQFAAVVCLLLLIAVRYYLLASELLLRPLFPWDAWMNWAPQPVTWFHYGGELVSFVAPGQWLEAGSEAQVYTHGAGKAWKNPDTVPLIQLWAMLGLGSSDHPLIYLSWLFVALAMGAALYGHLRLAGLGIPAAALACYALLNLPLLNVHTALAGYADIWLTAAFGGAVFALREWGEHRDWGYAIIVALLALLCALLKVPGLILGSILLGLLGLSIMRPSGRLVSWLLGLTGLLLLYALLVGISIPLGSLGVLVLSAGEIAIPYLGRYDLGYNPVHGEILATLFTMWNWNLLWYVFIGTGLLLLWSRWRGLLPALDLAALYLAMLFIFSTYFFSTRYQFAQDMTQFNRALIYTVPVVVFVLAIRAYRGFFVRESG